MDFIRLACLGLVQGSILFGSCAADDDVVVPVSATSVKFDFAEWCKVGGHKFTFENATLGEVIKALGCGQIVNVDASDPGNADPLWAVCYDNGRNVIRFEADGDIGGREHRLTGVSIGPATDFPVVGIPAIKERVKFRFGEIWMDFIELQRRLGAASLQGNRAVFEYNGTTRIPSRKDVVGSSGVFDVSGYLSVEVIEGKVVKIEMSHITSS